MTREYSPLGPSIFTSTEDSDYFGEPQDIHHDPQRPDDIPLIASRSRMVQSPDSSYDSGKYHAIVPDTPQDRNAGVRRWSQQSASTFRKIGIPSTNSFQSLRKSLLAPSIFKDIADPKRPYARYYSFRRTRNKLFVSCFKQWVVTALFTGAVAFVLAFYERQTSINNNHKHIFNAIITGLSICLGMNLASSLKGYAELMRWRLVTYSWLSLREFDLVLQCGSLRKTVELFFESRKRRWPYISLIQLICLAWLSFNVAAQIVVAMIGLTYSLDSAQNNSLVPGKNVSIADLRVIQDIYGSGNSEMSGQLASAHAYGIQGQDYNYYNVTDPVKASLGSWEALYTDADYKEFLYRFTDWNFEDTSANLVYASSIRTATAQASCTAYDVKNLSAAYDLAGNPAPGTLAFYNNGTSEEDTYLYVPEFAYGAITWMSFDSEFYDCGDRCNIVWALQTAQQESDFPNGGLTIPTSTIYSCNNSVSHISNLTTQGKKYALPDTQARYIAGAIGWTGYFTPIGNTTNDFQFLLYSNDSYWSPSFILPANGVSSAAMYVSQFSAAALAAMDQNGLYAIITDGLQPQPALMVTVQWVFTIPLLAAIVVLQLLALIVVVLWANKAVIVDESYLSIAKLLAPTVQKLGAHGSVLRGEEIAEAITAGMGGDYKVFYGCRVKDETEDRDSETGTLLNEYGAQILRADVIERQPGVQPKRDRPFSDGKYD